MSKKRVFAIAGAYVAWVMGSGFATGQEIFQFFTSYGYYSIPMIAITLVGFLLVGTALLGTGFDHKDRLQATPEGESGQKPFDHFKYFCGEKLGVVFDWFLPVSMFGGLVILFSGSGATLEEYYGLNHFVGAVLMASLACAAYVLGFERFLKIVSCIGPVIIAFTLTVGIITALRDADHLALVEYYDGALSVRQPAPFWWLSALLYISYNLCGGSKYYTALGASAVTRKEAVWGAIAGSVALMASVTLIDLAMMTEPSNSLVLGIPTLYLAKRVSAVLGALFSVVLLLGIFSSCSAMMWTICEKFVVQGTKKSYLFSIGIAAAALVLGLLPFASLIGHIYTAFGYIGLVFIGCVIKKRIEHRIAK